jgi:hypothetical protein
MGVILACDFPNALTLVFVGELWLLATHVFVLDMVPHRGNVIEINMYMCT